MSADKLLSKDSPDAVLDDDLLLAIFQGPLEETPWKSFLQLFGLRLHGKMPTITLRLPHLGTPREQIVHDTVCGAMVDAYIDHFFALDPIRHHPARLGQVILFDDVIPRSELKKTEFYQQFLLPNDIVYGMKGYFGDPNGLAGWLQIARGVEQENFSARDKTYCSAVLSHLALSLQLYGKLMQTETERQLYKGVVDRMAIGTIILDSRGQIMKMNNAAESIIDHQRCLKQQHGKLYARSPQHNRLLQTWIARAQEARAGLDDPHFIESMRLDGHAGKVGVLIKPAPFIPWYEGQTCPSVVVLLSDPTRPHIAPEELLINLLAISPAEARLALLLANGQNLHDIAKQHDISINTARTQLKSIFAKTGTHSQAELVRLILRSVAFLA